MRIQACSLSGLLAVFMCSLFPVGSHAESSGYEWMPPEAEHAGAPPSDTAATIRPLTEVSVPMPTADASKFTKVYTLELEKFGIHNDGTEAEATSKGINAALQHAKTVGANKIVFPAGTYLIHEKDPVIFDHQDTIVDLNGATLQLQKNGLTRYSVAQILPGTKNFRLTNGTIRGDRDEHDFETIKGDTHEGGHVLEIIGGDNLEIDHLHLTKGTGAGAGVSSTGARNRDELLARIYYDVERKNFESGAFSEKGEPVDSTEKIRTIRPYPMGDGKDRFEVGFLGGYMGFPWIKGRAYQAYFFDADQNFVEKKQCLQYRKVEVPAGAKFLHLEFNQPQIDEKPAHPASAEFVVRINNFTPPTDVHFHHNLMDFNRYMGLMGAGVRWLIEENRFENNGGTPPSFGIDLEDGWEMYQDIVLRKNTFKDNEKGDLVICAGSEILVEDNDFVNNVVVHGRAFDYTIRNNRFGGGYITYTTRSGIASIRDNVYKDVKRVDVAFDGRGYADGLNRKAGENVATPAILSTGESFTDVQWVTGTYINYRDSKFENTGFLAGPETRMISLENCTLDNVFLEVRGEGPDISFHEKNNTGDIPMRGEHGRIVPKQ